MYIIILIGSGVYGSLPMLHDKSVNSRSRLDHPVKMYMTISHKATVFNMFIYSYFIYQNKVFTPSNSEFFACAELAGGVGQAEDPMSHEAGLESTREDVFDDGLSEQIGLEEYLSRPIKVATYSWSPGTPFAQSIDPVTTFLSNASFQRKIANYKLIKFDIEFTVYTKGTKFHAGLILCSVRRIGHSNELVTIGSDSHLVTRSQRPHVDVEVGASQTGKLTIPYVNTFNWIDLTNDVDNSTALDTSLYMHVNMNSYADLVGAGTTDPVTVTVFLRAVNLKLAAPTTTMTAFDGPSMWDPLSHDFYACAKKVKLATTPKKERKAKPKARKPKVTSAPKRDEYQGNGPVSSVASAVASAAGALKDVPVIGIFARATEIGATAISGIASLFGFSKPAQIEDITPFRNFPVSSLALVEGADTSQKLTVTAKQELSVDPRTVGLSGEDELSIQFIAGTESYLTQFTWDPTDSVDDIIFQCVVDPMAEHLEFSALGTSIVPTALSFVSRPFNAWCGTLRYRLQVIGTAFHNGKIALIYEPGVLDPAATASADYDTNFYYIMDIAESRDVTFDITWQQGQPYSLCRNFYTSNQYYSTNSTPIRTDTERSNGTWYVRVLNELVVSDGSTPVTVIVKVSAADDFELMGPTASEISLISPFTPVAADGFSSFDPSEHSFYACSDAAEAPLDDFTTEDVDHEVLAPGDLNVTDLKSLTFYGERVMSIRQLIKRYTWYRCLTPPTTPSTNSVDEYFLTQFPLFYGATTMGVDTLNGVSYNVVGVSFITYFARAYGLWRGSVRYKFLPGNGDPSLLFAVRTPGVTNPDFTAYEYPQSQAQSTANRNAFFRYTDSGSGSAITVTKTMAALEVEVPHQSRSRADLVYADHQAQDNSYKNGHASGTPFSVQKYRETAVGVTHGFVAAGDDFTFLVWNGAPHLYRYPPISES